MILDKKDDTIAECDKFIDLYPNHPNLDYAYYLRALSNLERATFFQEILGQDVSKYDVVLKKHMTTSLLIGNRFKGSKYADDANNELIFLGNSMANHEIYISKYYFKRGAYLASSERAKYMLEKYPGAPATKDALILLIKNYNNLGSSNLAEETTKVLITNYNNYTYQLDENKNYLMIIDKNIDSFAIRKSFFNLGLF